MRRFERYSSRLHGTSVHHLKAGFGTDMTIDWNNRLRLFVINLARSPDRRQFMSEQLLRLGLPFDVFRAVDGHTLTDGDLVAYNREKRLRSFGDDLTPTEIGCYLSHYRLYRKIVTERIPRAVVFEDDTEISDDLPAILRALENSPESWEFIRLAGLRERKGKEVAYLGHGYRAVRLRHTACGSQAYIVNQQGARKLLDYGKEITRQVDITIDRYWENGLRIMAVQPYPAWPSSRFVSTIGAQKADVWRQPGKRSLRLPILAAKRLDSVNRRIYNLRTIFD